MRKGGDLSNWTSIKRTEAGSTILSDALVDLRHAARRIPGQANNREGVNGEG